MARIPQERFIKKGKYRTLETRWSTTKIRYYFTDPAGAKVRVQYGFGWFTKNRQNKTLDGNTTKILTIGFWGVTRAKIQIKTSVDTLVFYDIEPIGP